VPRKIIHLDLDAFFCSVEELLNPALAGKAFAVGGRPESRGVVASCSYAARMKGVHSAMPMAQAVRLCSGLIIVPGRHDIYSTYSQRVMAHFYQLTPLVEQISIDEAFLDVTDLPESGQEIAKKLQTAIHAEPGLPCSIGVATNKLVAKIATDIGKAARRGPTPPNAITIVPPGEEANFLAPLPVKALWGVGPKTTARLANMGITTLADLVRIPETTLVAHFGKNGLDLSRHARGIDDSPINTSHDTKSISQEITFDHDISEGVKLHQVLRSLSENVGRRLREENLVATAIKIKLRWPDFTTLTRQTTLIQAADQDNVIFMAASQLFDSVWQNGKSVRLLGVGASGLGPTVLQLGLWDTPNEKEHRLLEAVDQLRSRYGNSIIMRGEARGRKDHNPLPESHTSTLDEHDVIDAENPPSGSKKMAGNRNGPLKNSYWVALGRFLAGPYPRGENDTETRSRLRNLFQSGVYAFINLTEPGEYNLPSYRDLLVPEMARLAQDMLPRHIQIPIPDMSVPSTQDMKKILEAIETTLADGYNLYLHCFGGRGRTGMVVGCYLVNHGLGPRAALAQISQWRSNLPGGKYPSPETEDQRKMVLGWEKVN
jgi:DNA polymerase-4